MNILYLERKSFYHKDMFEVLDQTGHHVVRMPFPDIALPKEQTLELLKRNLRGWSCDLLVSLNYFPAVSACCEELGFKYAAWIYDSPCLEIYSNTIRNECNYIFLFDYALYSELKNSGVNTVYYLPFGVNEQRSVGLKNTEERRRRFTCDISFVASFYSEQEQKFRDGFDHLNPFARGYLDGMIQAQLHVYGYHFLQEMLTPDITAELERVYPIKPEAGIVIPQETFYADFVLAGKVTALERQEILKLLSDRYEVRLYTGDRSEVSGKACKPETVDSYDALPYVFRNSKINLNISPRSIRTGIPLRAMDIMGCGGFLLTNYQEELFTWFEPDKDFVYYSDYGDLCEKAEYYLAHEEIRKKIAQNGCEKVCKEHGLKRRVENILEIVIKEEREE